MRDLKSIVAKGVAKGIANRIARGLTSSAEGEVADGRIVAEMETAALQSNFASLCELASGQALIPMLKADGYGHGAAWVARNLIQHKNRESLYGLGVATLREGGELRKELDPSGRGARNVKIIVFSGATPWSDEKGEYCLTHRLTPMITTEDDWRAFYREGPGGRWVSKISYGLKFNTGMNRLGLSHSSAADIARQLGKLDSKSHPETVCTHLALGEDPEASLSLSQRERFASIRRSFASTCPGTLFHISNSAALWGKKLWGLDGLTDIVRPGLALYGVPPWAGAPVRGLVPVMTLCARVIAIARLKEGDRVGYGGVFKVSKVDAGGPRVATLAAGYADGIPRALGESGKVWLGGRLTRFLGRISMDLCAVEAQSDTRVGDWAEFLGPHIDPWIQAKGAGTIPYELFTSLSTRVRRVYESG